MSHPAIGLGCMNLSHAYGTPPSPRDATAMLQQAFELGVRHFDTAALYGFGDNEKLVGQALKSMRSQLFLASKCGMTGVNGARVIDGRAQTLNATINQSLKRLQTDYIDLYYLHRWDKEIPIEDSVGALSRMVESGKIGAIGLSEVSADTLRRAHNTHPINALQTEYSLWTRNPEIAVLECCRELGINFVAFSPLGRGFLTDKIPTPDGLADKDIRRSMPRFNEPHYQENLKLHAPLAAMAQRLHCSKAQLALAWVLAQGEHVLPIPGTTNLSHLRDNLAATSIVLSANELDELDRLFKPEAIHAPRYPRATQAEVDTEEFSALQR